MCKMPTILPIALFLLAALAPPVSARAPNDLSLARDFRWPPAAGLSRAGEKSPALPAIGFAPSARGAAAPDRGALTVLKLRFSL